MDLDEKIKTMHMYRAGIYVGCKGTVGAWRKYALQ